MNLKRLLVLLFAITACTDEAPTDVGDALIPSGDVRTFEVILDAATFLAYDTTFTGYTSAQAAPFSVIANDFGGVVDANYLVRLGQPPAVINVRNSAGTTVSDSAPQYFAGRLVLRLDTLLSDSEPPVRFRAFTTAEPWDFTATWTERIDSGNVKLPWQTPGGTRGTQIDTATWAAGDSLVFRVDSQTIAEWRDTTSRARGAIVVAESNNTRVRVVGAVLRASARSAIQQDTVFNFDVTPAFSVFIFDPPPPPPGSELRVGGITSWRTILGINPELRNLTFPCPGLSGCVVRLDRAHINLAELLLQPATTAPGYLPEDSIFVQARTLLVSSGIPLQRSPIGVGLLRGAELVAASAFADPAQSVPVRINITDYIFALVDEDVDPKNRPPNALTLLGVGEPATFGFATFAPGPRLRLVLTAPLERTP